MNKRQLKKLNKRMSLEVDILNSHIEYLKDEVRIVEKLYYQEKTKCNQLTTDNSHLRLAYKTLEDLYREQAADLNKQTLFRKVSRIFKKG